MKQKFIVADNAFSVSVDHKVEAWNDLQSHFKPFEVEINDEETILTIEIVTGEISEEGAELIYQPDHNEVSLMRGKAFRSPQGGLWMDFRPLDNDVIRLRLETTEGFHRAKIILNPNDDGNDPYILTHALMLAYLLAASSNGTLMIHASAVVNRGKAYLFQGKSGTGKSTHARLWTKNVLGTKLLNDDHPLIRLSADGIAMAYGSPWSGKTDCYLNGSAPIAAFVRIIRGKNNELSGIKNPLKAYASLMTSIFFLPFFPPELRDLRHKAIEKLVGSVPCFEMYCRPDAEAALTCFAGINESNNL